MAQMLADRGGTPLPGALRPPSAPAGDGLVTFSSHHRDEPP